MTARQDLREVIDNINDLCGHRSSAAKKESADENACKDDQNTLSIEEIIGILSAMHLRKSTDPETLAGSTFHDFDKSHKRFTELFTLQPLLFQKCKDRGDRWML